MIRVIIEYVEKINIIKRLETEKKNNKKRAKKIRSEKIDELKELERGLNFVAIKNRFCGRPSSIKDGLN